MEGRFGGAGGFGVDSVAEAPGEFVARLGPDGLAAGGACSAGGSAALDVVDVNQPLVLVEGVRHSDVGHLGSSPDSVMRCTSVYRELAVLAPVWVWADRMEKWPWGVPTGVNHGFRHLGWTWRLWLWFQSVFQSVSGRIRPQFLAQKWAVIRWQQVGLELSSAWCSSRGLLDPNRDRSAVRLWCAGGLKSQ